MSSGVSTTTSIESNNNNNNKTNSVTDNNNNNNKSNNTNTMTMTKVEEPIALQNPIEDITVKDSTDSTEITTPLAAAKTPPRTSLANDPGITPIASCKRTRSSRKLATTTATTPGGAGVGSSGGNNNNKSISDLTPMHGVKAVPQRDEKNTVVDDIFSPVAAYYDGIIEHDDHGSISSDNDDDDDDQSMDKPEHPSDDSNEFNPWQFIQNLPPYESVKERRPAISLPPLLLQSNKKKTVVLDLDETLVHCSVEAPSPDTSPADLTFPVNFHGIQYTVYVKKRPYLLQFLQSISNHYEVIVFTASQKVYADALLDLIDKDHKYIHHRLFRESCLAVEGNFLKDLHVLGRDLSTTVLVDNSPHAFGYQIDNGIPIESWFDDVNDKELIKLERFLIKKILHCTDVRDVIRNKFQVHHLVATAPPLTNNMMFG